MKTQAYRLMLGASVVLCMGLAALAVETASAPVFVVKPYYNFIAPFVEGVAVVKVDRRELIGSNLRGRRLGIRDESRDAALE